MNKLSLWTFPYSTRYYVLHPWKFVREIWVNVRNMWHRARYGYAYMDVWDFCTWYPYVGAQALKYLAEHNSGYPGVEPWETPEEWHTYLLELAKKLEFCAHSQDIGFHDKENEYTEEFYSAAEKILNENNVIKPTSINSEYFEREKELNERDQRMRTEIFKEVGENLCRLWD